MFLVCPLSRSPFSYLPLAVVTLSSLTSQGRVDTLAHMPGETSFVLMQLLSPALHPQTGA